jgi:hypothetical protein
MHSACQNHKNMEYYVHYRAFSADKTKQGANKIKGITEDNFAECVCVDLSEQGHCAPNHQST